MIEKNKIEEIISQFFIDNGFELDKISVNKENNIKIFFDHPERAVTIDDCATVSRFIEKHLDRDVEDFSLMVSSSGKEKKLK